MKKSYIFIAVAIVIVVIVGVVSIRNNPNLGTGGQASVGALTADKAVPTPTLPTGCTTKTLKSPITGQPCIPLTAYTPSELELLAASQNDVLTRLNMSGATINAKSQGQSTIVEKKAKFQIQAGWCYVIVSNEYVCASKVGGKCCP